MGAAIPETWLEKLMIPPTLPTEPRGAINDGIDHPIGEAADRPPIDRLIQSSAERGPCGFAAPRIPSPQAIPPTRIVLRTRLAFHPRWISASASRPPMAR